jgi:hypothetical protein
MDKLCFFVTKPILITTTWLTFLLAGCGSYPDSNIQPVRSVPSATCEPTTVPDIYAKDLSRDTPNNSRDIAEKIYNQALVGTDISIVRREAFKFLIHQTERWTQVEDLTPHGEPKVRTTVIFFSPELIRAIILTHLLYRFNPQENPDLETYTSSTIKRFDQRNELMFLLIVQTESNNNKTFSIAPKNIRLHNTSSNASGISISRHDKILDQQLNFRNKPYWGYLYFPNGIMTNGGCMASIDPSSDTNITLTTNSANIGNVKEININWSFCYCSLLSLDGDFYKPWFGPDNPGASSTKPSPKDTLPSFDYNIEQNSSAFYAAIAEFVWGRMTAERDP